MKAIARGITTIIERIYLLIVKLISRKGFVLAIATWLVHNDKIDAVTWGIAAAGIVGAAAYEKQKNAARLDK